MADCGGGGRLEILSAELDGRTVTADTFPPRYATDL
jgi:hypothetical protein